MDVDKKILNYNGSFFMCNDSNVNIGSVTPSIFILAPVDDVFTGAFVVLITKK